MAALVFDFDGLVLDTETPSYRAWCEEYEEHGLRFDRAAWVGVVGTHHAHGEGFDPVAVLQQHGGRPLSRAEAIERHRRRFLAYVAEEPVRPGVVDLIEEAVERKLALAVASSSPRGWVVQHLTRLGLIEPFDAVVGRDDVGGIPKPSPRVYLEALARLDHPSPVVALEDSAPGLRAARAAGIVTAVVPNELTAGSDFSGAATILTSLAGVRIDDLLSLASLGAAEVPR